MRKSSILFIALLAVVAFIAVDIYFHLSESGISSSEKAAFDNAALSITATVDPIAAKAGDQEQTIERTESVANDSGMDSTTSRGVTTNSSEEIKETSNFSGIAIDPRILIENLDKETDETISYVYKKSPENITVGSMYEGDFTGSGKPELLVVFKLLEMPHAGGLDCSVAAVYDRSTLEIITQKTFAYDECHFNILKDEAQKGYLLFVGSATYQGYSQYTLGLWKPGKEWTDLYPPSLSNPNDNKKFELKEDGSIWVSRPEYESPETHEITWLHEYNLLWNKERHTLDEIVPSKYKAAGESNVDAVSVSPDGKYAISTLLDQYRVLLFDVSKNSLVNNFEMPAQDYGFMWSPDSSKVSVTKAARVWIETSIVDVASQKIIEIPPLLNTFKENGVKLSYTLNENRPDPYVTPIEWSPDSKKILLFYQWTDSDYNRQNGTFIFDVASQKITRITQNESVQEGGNIPAQKPNSFKW